MPVGSFSQEISEAFTKKTEVVYSLIVPAPALVIYAPEIAIASRDSLSRWVRLRPQSVVDDDPPIVINP
jgi:hypothetical protein